LQLAKASQVQAPKTRKLSSLIPTNFHGLFKTPKIDGQIVIHMFSRKRRENSHLLNVVGIAISDGKTYSTICCVGSHFSTVNIAKGKCLQTPAVT